MTTNLHIRAVLIVVLVFAALSQGAIIFVDNRLAADCLSGEYSIAHRDNSGSDGDAYNTPQKAANVSNPGDTIYFRAGTYWDTGGNATNVLHITRDGTAENPITYTNYNGEEAILSGQNSQGLATENYTIQIGTKPSSATTGAYPNMVYTQGGTGASYVTIDGLTVIKGRYSGIQIYGESNPVPPGLTTDHSLGIIIRNCICRDNYQTSVKWTGNGIASFGKNVNCLIENNECYHNSNSGIALQYVSKQYDFNIPQENWNAAQHAIIRNNLCYDNNNPVDPGAADGIVLNGSNHSLVQGNILFRNGDDGLDTYGSVDANILDNIIFDNRKVSGGNGIKVGAGSGGRHTIIGNVVWNNSSRGFEDSHPSERIHYQVGGPYQAPWLDYYPNILVNNIFYHNDGIGIVVAQIYDDLTWPGFEKMYMRNNITFGNNYDDVAGTARHDVFYVYPDEVDADYNFIADAVDIARERQGGNEAHCITGDPKLVNPTVTIDTTFGVGWTHAQKLAYIRNQVKAAFSPLKGSVIVDAGTRITGHHNQNPGDGSGDDRAWYGSAPDIGVHEVALNDITDLSVSGTSQNSATIVWTAPGGQNYRKPTQYDVRYADSSITEATWGTATQAQGEPVPGDFGAQESFTITGLNPGATYHVAIKTSDELGNTSWLSNVVTGTTTTTGNHAPILEPISDQLTYETQSLTFTVSATEVDAGDTLTYSATNTPLGSSFNPATRTFTWTPTTGQSGTYHVTFQVTDSYVVVSWTVPVEVRETVDHAPVLAAVGDQTVNENAPLTFPVSATDEDGDTLTYSATGLPSGANLASGVFSWIPKYDQAGSYQVAFTVSDGQLTDSEQITITVIHVSDRTAPAAHDFYPVPDAIQVPVNALIALTISDDGSGVDANTVAISVNNQLVYSGDSSLYESAYGVCRRTGTRASYRYYYRPAQAFGFDEHVSVYVTASDAAHNAMTPVFYQFVTEMRSFGRNQPVGSSSDSSGHPAIATDSQGNIWAAWHAGQANARDIYVAKRGGQSLQWDAPLRLTSLASDQCNPAIAIGSGDTLHVVWQDNRRGNWDIYGCTSADGSTWQDAVRITDSNDNQTNPVIAADHAAPSQVYVAWEDDGFGNRDIYLASSNTHFASKTITRVTSNPADQTEPALAVASDNTVYLVWTDQRNGSADIYGSSSSASSWANVPIATGPGNQSNPAITVEPGTSTLHVLWADDAAGNLDVVHGTSNGLPGSPISGTRIVDDATGADQSAPAIVAAKDPGNNTHVYACWQDNRSVGSAHDSDLYFVEIRSGTGGTNILVGDDGTNSNQSDPALGCDKYGQPAIVWTDSRGSTPRIYSACSTYFKPAPLASALITRSAGGRVGVDPASIDDDGDVSIQIPANACDCDVVVSISEIQNLPKFTALCVAGHEIGPSGVQFSFPATVTIPYTGSGSGRATPYWYDAQTGTLSQQGMTEITNTTPANGILVVSFKTTHLTTFYILESPLPTGGVNGGGGCALSNSQEGSIVEFLLPYGALVLLMLILKRRDRRYKGI